MRRIEIRPGRTIDAVLDKLPNEEFVAVCHFTGSADIDVGVPGVPGCVIAPVFLRAHFVGGSGTASINLGVRSMQGTAYDAQLYSIRARGLNADANARWTADEIASAWAIGPRDAMTIAWTNPSSGTMTWGLVVGVHVVPVKGVDSEMQG